MLTTTLRFPFVAEPAGAKIDKTIAIGYFDGVHTGHQTVIGRAVELARASGISSAVMTFDPHPKAVLGKSARYSALLTPMAEKLRLFEQLGVDFAYIVTFDREFASVSPESFVSDLLTSLRVADVAVGFDFTFGRGGTGNPELLTRLAKPDMGVHVAEPFALDGLKISSTRIRLALAEGGVESAAVMLGRPYRISGEVVHGDARGRTIGYPTANVDPDGDYVLPRFGVYAVEVADGERRYPGVLNVGVKPTFQGDMSKPKLEAHLFDYTGDLYGRKLAIDFISFIREERKFDDVQALIAQIAADAETARGILAARG